MLIIIASQSEPILYYVVRLAIYQQQHRCRYAIIAGVPKPLSVIQPEKELG